jgi:hypothetical protein
MQDGRSTLKSKL